MERLSRGASQERRPRRVFDHPERNGDCTCRVPPAWEKALLVDGPHGAEFMPFRAVAPKPHGHSFGDIPDHLCR
eukprot:11166656-Lingulodinium_polyedra.AAC.1